MDHGEDPAWGYVGGGLRSETLAAKYLFWFTYLMQLLIGYAIRSKY